MVTPLDPQTALTESKRSTRTAHIMGDAPPKKSNLEDELAALLAGTSECAEPHKQKPCPEWLRVHMQESCTALPLSCYLPAGRLPPRAPLPLPPRLPCANRVCHERSCISDTRTPPALSLPSPSLSLSLLDRCAVPPLALPSLPLPYVRACIVS